MTKKQRGRIQQLHELRAQECDKALEAIDRDDYLEYLCYEASARSIGKQISELLDTWYSK